VVGCRFSITLPLFVKDQTPIQGLLVFVIMLAKEHRDTYKVASIVGTLIEKFSKLRNDIGQL
jgi:hypothetical protein